MTSWKKLPYEIRLQIGQDLYQECKENTTLPVWRQVNRDFYELFQILDYSSTELIFDFGNDKNKRVESVLSSPFQPGRWVTSASSLRLKVPLNNDFRIATDPLYLFMERCPNMTNIEAICLCDAQITLLKDQELWMYFSRVLLKDTTWKLKSIPPCGGCGVNSVHYMACAYHMKKSLTHLSLTDGNIIHMGLGIIPDFEKLTSLQVGGSILRDLYSCGTFVSQLPQLERFKVMIRNPQPVSKLQITKDELKNMEINKSIHHLNLRHYAPSTNQELLYLMHTFPNAKELYIYGSNATWPNKALDPSTLGLFLKYLSRMDLYRIETNGETDVRLLMNLYYAAQESLDNCKTSLLVALCSERVLRDARQRCRISFHKEKDNIPQLKVPLSDVIKPENLKLKDILATIDQSVQDLRIKWLDRLGEIGHDIDYLLARKHIHVKSVEFKTGLLSFYNTTQNMEARGHHIKKLTFKHNRINSTVALPPLSKDFPCLDTLEFESCTLSRGRQIIVSMESTSVNKFVIREEPILTSSFVILLSVDSLEERKSNYYLQMTSNKPYHEIKKDEYDTCKTELRKYVEVVLRFKSIKRFKITRYNETQLNEEEGDTDDWFVQV